MLVSHKSSRGLARLGLLLVAVASVADAALLIAQEPPQQVPVWRAGIGRAKITPEGPIWMAGYASRTRPSEDVLTDLWTKAMLIEDAEGSRILLITLDLVGIERSMAAEICRELMEQFSLDRSSISLATSHTHSGPVVGKNLRPMHLYQLSEEHQRAVIDYSEWVQQRILQAVDEAVGNLQPVHLSWGSGIATFATNRRNNPEADVPARRASATLEGPVDHSVPVLVVSDSRQQVLAIAFGYACHATVLSEYRISGDYPGFAQIELERRFPGATALFWAGCGGDQNPLPRRTEVLAEHYGRALALAVESVIRTHRLRPISGRLDSRYREVDLAFAEVPTVDILRKMADSKDRYEAARASVLLQVVETHGALPAWYPYPVQTWRLGDEIEWVHLGGEVVVDYAARIKSERRNQTTWVAAYTNDVMAYIPSRRVLREGGYEGATAMVYYGLPSPWAENVEETILAEVHRQLEEIADPRPPESF